jgi:hypothetical protein
MREREKILERLFSSYFFCINVQIKIPSIIIKKNIGFQTYNSHKKIMASIICADHVEVSLHNYDSTLDSQKFLKLCNICLINCEIRQNQRISIGRTSIYLKIESFCPQSDVCIVTGATRIAYVVNKDSSDSLPEVICGIDQFMTRLYDTISQEMINCENEMSAIGMLIHAPSSHGKTTILKHIQNRFAPQDSWFLDCSTLHSRCQRQQHRHNVCILFLYCLQTK